MSWLKDILSVITGNDVDIEMVKKKIQTPSSSDIITETELNAYIDDINTRIKSMVKELKAIYAKYDIQFSGFKSFDMACNSLRASLKDGKEEAHNNLIKLESAITSEQKRHLGLIKMAVTKDGKKVYEKIMQDPTVKEQFNNIFGNRETAGQQDVVDGTYQRLWSEVHKLAEYIISQKNRVYH